jgi:hypothetical protein
VVSFRNGHFYVVALDYTNNVSTILVSGTGSNPATGVHCNYGFVGSLGAGTFSDFPKTGVTLNRTIVTTNVFGGSAVQSLVTIITSSSIVPGASNTCPGAEVEQWFNFYGSDGNLAFTQVPATDYDADSANAFQLWSVHWGSSSNADVWKRSSSFGSADWNRYTLTTGGYSIPPEAPQPNTTAQLDSGDDRLQGAVKRYGIVWLSHDTAVGGCPQGATANAHIMNARSASSSTAGVSPGPAPEFYYLEGPDRCANYDLYPMAAPDGNGNLLFGFDRSGPSTYVQMRAGGWHYAQGLGASALLKGSACSCTDGSGRWGDYGAAAVDASNQDYVWFAQELLSGNSSWTTGIARAWWQPNPARI